jgi:hemolysin III
MPPERVPSRGEEIANTVSHGAALVAALAVVPVLIGGAIARGKPVGVIATAVFAGTMVLLYATSTLYHALRAEKAKHVVRVLDHAAIFLLIAGTYTPFTLGVLSGAWGWTLFGLVWTLALAGVALKVAKGFRHPKLSMFLYLAMGWSIVMAIHPLWLHMESRGLLLLVAGGLAYTAGAVFYGAKRLRYGHLVWHLFVVAGTGFHAAAVHWYAG